MLSVKDLCKSYGDAPVVESVSFELCCNETLAIVGPSGCGKTTLLYLLAGLAQPDSGVVELGGDPILKPRQDVSIILQDYGLLPWRTVAQNVALGLRIQGISKRERLRRAGVQLDQLGIQERENDYPGNLSGGEQQRVAIARAMVSHPSLLLLDEPFSSLDALTREELQDSMLKAWRNSQAPYVLVTHSLDEAVYLGARILVLTRRPAQQLTLVENMSFGIEGARTSKEYFSVLRELRQIVEEAWR